jgi:hypothetical protein
MVERAKAASSPWTPAAASSWARATWALVKRDQLGAGPHLIEQGSDHGADPLHRVPSLGPDAAQLLGDLLDQLVQQLVTRPGMPVDGGCAHAQLGGQPSHAQTEETVPLEDVGGGRQHGLGGHPPRGPVHRRAAAGPSLLTTSFMCVHLAPESASS